MTSYPILLYILPAFRLCEQRLSAGVAVREAETPEAQQGGGAGGTHIQYNIVDSEELRDTKLHPEEHRDLIVRVGGFSAYFVQLSPGIQDDVIGRSEQVL